MKTINPETMDWTEFQSPSGKFHSFQKNISLALGGVKDVGAWAGGHPFDLQQRRVPPGASVCPLHAHGVQWELFIILAGEATIRTGDTRQVVRAGEIFMQPPGTAHQTTNTGTTDLIFYVIADNSPADSTYYPDSKKWMLKPPGRIFRMTEVDYYDGED